ncbi:MAG: iron export ABC transporter permease subunit FetB [bacterium]
MNDITYIHVLKSLVLVILAIGISRYWKIDTTKDMIVGTIRSFIQLIAIGYALKYIFEPDYFLLNFGVLTVMLTMASYTAAQKLKYVPKPFLICLISIATGSLITLVSLMAINPDWFTARYLIPLGGMIISNSMNACTLSADRLGSDVKNNRLAIETSLSLGKTWNQASQKYQKEATTTGMISILNFMKTVGLVALPGAMTGMILGGAEPLEAVLLQMVVAYMLLSAVTITSIAVVQLTIRQFFTNCHQLIISE